MKTTFLFVLILLAIGCKAQNTNNDKMIKSTINEFVKAGDTHDVSSLDVLLNENFRITMNQLFGSEEVTTVDKEFYLSKIESKEWGGDQRKVTIENLVVVGKNASAKVTTTGSQMSMISLMQLVQNSSGNWQIIGDIPSIE